MCVCHCVGVCVSDTVCVLMETVYIREKGETGRRERHDSLGHALS